MCYGNILSSIIPISWTPGFSEFSIIRTKPNFFLPVKRCNPNPPPPTTPMIRNNLLFSKWFQISKFHCKCSVGKGCSGILATSVCLFRWLILDSVPLYNWRRQSFIYALNIIWSFECRFVGLLQWGKESIVWLVQKALSSFGRTVGKAAFFAAFVPRDTRVGSSTNLRLHCSPTDKKAKIYSDEEKLNHVRLRDKSSSEMMFLGDKAYVFLSGDSVRLEEDELDGEFLWYAYLFCDLNLCTKFIFELLLASLFFFQAWANANS